MVGRVSVAGLGFVAPGIADAEALHAHLDGAPIDADEGWRASPATLPPRQARRLSGAIALAVAAAEQIAPVLPRDAAWVFASSVGEGETLRDILSALAQPDIMVQPIKFQNAVHNAAQGQWSILAGAEGPATSIAAHDETVGAGLLKAAMQLLLERRPVGLVIFDAPLPPPLHEKRPLALPMAAALALTVAGGTLGSLLLSLDHGAAPTDPSESGAGAPLLGSANPVRFALPLLARIQRGDPRPVVLRLPGGGALCAACEGGDAR
jgi:Beta-ketoacyl synthase, N-terminal domain